MNGFTHAALAGAILATALAPQSVYAQSRNTIVRAAEIGRGSRIGVSVADVDGDAARDSQAKSGVRVQTVAPAGPADKAGLKSGDTITEFDGERVRSVRQFSRLVQETPAGRSVPVAVSRGGQHLSLTVTAEATTFDDGFGLRPLELFARPAQPPSPPLPPSAPRAPLAPPAPPAPFDVFRYIGGRRLGVTIETLDDQLAQYFGVKEGALVKSVAANSDAEKLGVKAGDVITAVNGRRIYEASDVNRAIDRMDDTGDITIEVSREKKTQTLKGKLEAPTRNRGTGTF